MKDELYTKKVTVYISENQAQRIKNLPRNFNLSGQMREALEEILIKGGWDCIKTILKNEDIRKYFLEINSRGNESGEFIWLRPDQTTHLIIPTKEYYGIKLTFKDVNGKEIPDSAEIEVKKKVLEKNVFGNYQTITKELGKYFYKEFKAEFKPLINKIELSYPDELIICVESKYARIISDIQFKFAVNFCTMKQ